jgi:hypothetical protein
MSQRRRKANDWHEAPMPREQLVLIPTALEELIPEDHPVRLVDEILNQLDWNQWEAAYKSTKGRPPIHPSVDHRKGPAIRHGSTRSQQSGYRIQTEALDRFHVADLRPHDRSHHAERIPAKVHRRAEGSLQANG